MKTIIGAGILSLPYTISKLGYVLGILMFLIILTIIQFNTWMLLKAKNLSKHSNYSTIGYFIFKNKIT
jgi:amino acid permease